MDDDDAMQALAHHEELLHRQWLEEQMLRADPNYQRWLDSLNATKGDDDGTHCEGKSRIELHTGF